MRNGVKMTTKEAQDEFYKKYKNKLDITKKGNKLIVGGGGVYLDSLTSLPERVEFKNESYVYLNSLTSLPERVEFKNKGNVYLNSLTSLSEGFEFKNKGNVYLDSLTSLPEGFEFKKK